MLTSSMATWPKCSIHFKTQKSVTIIIFLIFCLSRFKIPLHIKRLFIIYKPWFIFPGSSHSSYRTRFLITYLAWRRLRNIAISTPSFCRRLVTSYSHATSVATTTTRLSASIFSTPFSSCTQSSTASNTTTLRIPYGSLWGLIWTTSLQPTRIENEQGWRWWSWPCGKLSDILRKIVFYSLYDIQTTFKNFLLFVEIKLCFHKFSVQELLEFVSLLLLV